MKASCSVILCFDTSYSLTVNLQQELHSPGLHGNDKAVLDLKVRLFINIHILFEMAMVHAPQVGRQNAVRLYVTNRGIDGRFLIITLEQLVRKYNIEIVIIIRQDSEKGKSDL